MRFFVGLLLALSTIIAAPSFPTLSGVVVDEAGLLSHDERQRIVSSIEAFHQTTDAQVVVAIVKSLQGYDIADYGYQLGRHWGIGSKEKNNGIVLIVAPNEREVRIEVGYGLEGVMSDFAASKIIENIIIPEFKKAAMPVGIQKGVDAIIKRITDPNTPIQGESSESSILSDILVLGFFLLVGVIRTFFKPIFPAVFFASIAAIMSIAITNSWIAAVVVFVIVFIVAFILFSFGSSSGSSSGGSSGRSSGGSGGFSGGGGSFGGGGSSGKW